MQQLIDTLLNGTARYTQSHHFGAGWALALVLGVLFAEFIAVYLIFMLLVKAVQNIRAFIGAILRRCGIGEKEVPQTFLELVFPANTTKSAYATEQLHVLLRRSSNYPHFWDRLAARKQLHSLELAGTKDGGIRYIMAVPTREVEYIEHSLRSYLPGLKIRETQDYLTSLANTSVGVVELKLGADFGLPLQDHKALAEHDFIAYLTGHMTKLAADELIAFQIVVTPVFKMTHPNVVRHIRRLQHAIALRKELSTKLKPQRTPLQYMLWLLWYPPLWFISAQFKILGVILGVIGAIFSSDHEFPKSDRDRQGSNPYELELGKVVKTKLDQHLFEVTIRLLVASSDQHAINNRLDALVASFQPFSTSYQGIRTRQDLPLISSGARHLSRFRERVLSPHFLSQQTIVSSSELSDLYHFPNTDLTKTEGFVKSRSRELAAPLSIKRSDAKLDVIVGVNEHGGEVQPIGMTLEQRQKHTYVIGKTGTGKSTMLTNAIYQDMLTGKGLAVLDPHGDMFRELLELVPKNRRKDVVVFDPSDRAYPVGLNILDPGVRFDDEETAHEWITSAVLSVFSKVTNKVFWGPRMEHVLRNATMTVLQLPNPSLYSVQRLLTDKQYRKTAMASLKDPVLKQYWVKEFASYGEMQIANLVAPLTHRMGHFITTKMSRHILLQEKSTISLSEIMDEGKILLVNLSKGDIGEDQSFFFGTLFTSLIWTAAYQRTKIPEKQRRDFFVYVDEFQNFATPQFTDITSEGRKFHISLTVSHQNIAQVADPSILKIVAGNADTIICLKASPDDEAFILPFMQPEVEKGDIVNLAPYKFFMKTTTDDSEEAFSGTTLPLDTPRSKKTSEVVLQHSRNQFATPREEVEAHLNELFGDGEDPPKSGSKPKKSSI